MNGWTLLLTLSITLCYLFASVPATAAEFNRVVVRIGDKASAPEENVAKLLAERLGEPSGIPASVEREGAAAELAAQSFLILLGIPANHAEITAQFDALRIPALTELEPGPEGFLLKSVTYRNNPALLSAGIDARGVLYAAGEILRRVTIMERTIEVSQYLDIRSAPAFEVRGTQFGQSGVAKEKAHVRPWTREEAQRKILDYALAGANTFEIGEQTGVHDPMYRFIKSFDLKTLVHYGANTGSGPPEWQASESIGRTGYLCPSVPEARQALLDKCEGMFKNCAFVDYVRLVGGDGGGCECDRCEPYGKTFIYLCADMADIIHKYHPNTQIFVTNQKFDNADDIAIFKYLQEKPRPWLRAFCYGPGSDAMSWQPGHRQTHRMDLFRYPGFGPFGRYLEEILHQLPPEQDIVFFNEITHWRYSQHGFAQMYPRADREGNQPPHWNHFIYERRPDQALTMVYDRLTFFACPRYYHWVFNQIMRYGIGDVTHSSGTHDHFNQWMWQRLLWAPQTSVEAVVDDYSRTWFGAEAAPLMAKAIFELECNIEEDPKVLLANKEGIDTYYQLVKQAGERIPAIHLKNNWLWREYMQKGAIEKYTQLSVRQQTELQKRIETHIAKALGAGNLDEAIAAALPWFEQMNETPEMQSLREEAGRLGEESNTLYGVRSEGYFNLKHDFIGIGWMKRQLERAKAAAAPDKLEMLRLVVDYENPGEGGFYDNLGTFNIAPHAVFGYPYDHGQPYVTGMLSEANRPSQRSMHFTQDEDQGVTLQYRDLDPKAKYKVRFTFVRPWYQERYNMRMNQKSQTIYADDFVLAKDLELPLQMSDFFTFDIPQDATKDGGLVIRLERAAEVAHGTRVEREQWRNSGGWGTLVSEVWLMKK